MVYVTHTHQVILLIKINNLICVSDCAFPSRLFDIQQKGQPPAAVHKITRARHIYSRPLEIHNEIMSDSATTKGRGDRPESTSAPLFIHTYKYLIGRLTRWDLTHSQLPKGDKRNSASVS